jgi:hypothetical protein
MFTGTSRSAVAYGGVECDGSPYRRSVVGDTEIQQLLPDNTIGMGAVASITTETADEFINSPALNQIKAANSAFAEWFDRNHYSKSYFDKTGKEVTKYFRVKAWSVTRPSDSKYYVKTKITNPANGLELEIPGIPISKYTYTRVKDKYRTIPFGADKSQYIGTIIDNKGKYLPREYSKKIGKIQIKRAPR